MGKLDGKVAIVTGSSRGIGKGIAKRLAAEGAKVICASRTLNEGESVSEGSLNTVVSEIEAAGGTALAVQADVTKSEETKQMVKVTLDRFGGIDILVNNAGGSARERGSPFCESTEEIWDYVLGINLKGVLNCCRAVINNMIERHSGKIVNIASCAGIVGDANLADYSAAKAGIIGFTMALAKEVASYDINVNCVSPGPTERGWSATPSSNLSASEMEERLERLKRRTGMNRLCQPEDIAALVAFLVSDEASFITGQNYPICGVRNLGV